jgi:hypothetical protein
MSSKGCRSASEKRNQPSYHSVNLLLCADSEGSMVALDGTPAPTLLKDGHSDHSWREDGSHGRFTPLRKLKLDLRDWKRGG